MTTTTRQEMTPVERQEWLQMRKNYIGASDAPIIMNGLHFNKTPYMLWREKLGIGADTADTYATRNGKNREEEARQAYEKYTGTQANPEDVFHPEKKFMRASLDGLSTNRDTILEIKHAGAADHALAKSGKVPEKYWAQVQHQLACIPAKKLDYFSCLYDGDDRVIVEVERDEDYIERLYQKEGHFWDQVLCLEAPDLTSKDFQDKKSSKEWGPLEQRWAALHQQIQPLLEEEKACRKLLIDMAGDLSAIGHCVRVTRVVRKGTVNYKAIPELIGVDLEAHRKKAVEAWRLQLIA